jgi:hypothetical protein
MGWRLRLETSGGVATTICIDVERFAKPLTEVADFIRSEFLMKRYYGN